MLMFGSDADAADRAVKALRQIETGLPRAIRTDQWDQFKAAERRARAGIKAMPVKGRKRRGLRRQIAKGTKANRPRGQVSYDSEFETSLTSDRIVWDGQPYDLPAAFDQASDYTGGKRINYKHGWRHPVFGHRNTWVVQRSAYRWFQREVDEIAPGLRGDVDDSLDQAAKFVKGFVGR